MKPLTIACATLLAAGAVQAEPVVGITKSMPSVTVAITGGPSEIVRIQAPFQEIAGEWARTSRHCPDFCIQPVVPAPEVSAFAEPELLELLQDPVPVVVDSRTDDWFEGGRNSGAVTIPYPDIVDELGRLWSTSYSRASWRSPHDGTIA